MTTTTCTIVISEADGALSISANVSEEAEKTIAGVLTQALVQHSAKIMNDMMGDNQVVQKVRTQ